MKKILIVGGIIVIVAIAAYAMFRIMGAEPSATPGTETQPEIADAPSSSSSVTHGVFPSGKTLTIGGPAGSVKVKNFYNNFASINENFVIIKKNTAYEIGYDTYDSTFYITLMNSSSETRGTGEKDFLASLGISQSDACRLTVQVAVFNESTGMMGKSSRLSFCGGGL